MFWLFVEKRSIELWLKSYRQQDNGNESKSYAYSLYQCHLFPQQENGHGYGNQGIDSADGTDSSDCSPPCQGLQETQPTHASQKSPMLARNPPKTENSTPFPLTSTLKPMLKTRRRTMNRLPIVLITKTDFALRWSTASLEKKPETPNPIKLSNAKISHVGM
jgi:hypothetical protein